MKKECWKATRYGKSWVAEYLPPKFALSYSLGKTTKPDVGDILCFQSPKDLWNFVDHEIYFFLHIEQEIASIIIFKGLAQNPTPLEYICSAEESDLNAFWKAMKGEKGIDSYSWWYAPKGTISTSAFTPTEQYSYDQFTKLMGGKHV